MRDWPQARFGALLLAACCAAHGQTALVETATMTAMREAVRVYVQEVRMDTGAVAPMATQLPGTAPEGPLFVTETGYITTTQNSENDPGLVLAGSTMGALRIDAGAWLRVQGEGSLLAGLAGSNDGSNARAIMVSTLAGGPLRGYGRIAARPYTTAPAFSFGDTAAHWILPGAPAAAVTNPKAGWVAVLCRTTAGSTVLHVRDVLHGRVILEHAPIARASEHLEPAALALSPDGASLMAILNDVDVARNPDEGACWFAPIDAQRGTPIGVPVELPGTASTGAALTFAPDESCWVATRSPSAGFAYVHRLARDGDHYEIRAQESYTGVSHALLVAASETSAVAVAAERRVAIWPGGTPVGEPLVFEAPIAAIAWSGDTVLIGEANRVHAVNAGHDERWTTSLQTGQVTAIRVLPSPVAQNRFSDSDYDGLADAVDPEPDDKSPFLDLPPEIQLHAEAAGTEVRAVRVDSLNAGDSIWRAGIDAERAPWLRVFPRQGRAPGWFIVGIDPTLVPRIEEPHASIRVSMQGTNALHEAASSPCTVNVRVVPRSAVSHSVLWMLANRETRELIAPPGGPAPSLAQTLSGPPFYWSQIDNKRRARESIGDYAAVVLDADGIENGGVSRQALFDYVSRGGGLLFIARTGDRGGVAQRWLAPAGIVLENGPAKSGAMYATVPHPVTRHWANFAMQDPARMSLDDAMTVLARDGDTAGLAVRQFGRGRIAVLASPSPLRPGAVANRLFAFDLFEWLSRSVIETKDSDADGLPDGLEDKNANGVVDRGETSKIDPDSDGDGIPDGKEDSNANGQVDNGETSPLNKDTDGDGNLDGADYDPVPPMGAPVVSSITPSSGPAEGGTRVTLRGQNLGSITSVWFGARRARIVDATSTSGPVIEVPPSARTTGDPVDVRIENARGQIALLSGGYAYAARSHVTLGLSAVASTGAQFEGIVTLSIAAPAGAAVGRVAVRLDTEPTAGLEWSGLRVAPEAEVAGRRVVQTETHEWGIAFEVTPPEHAGDTTDLVTVRCRLRNLLNPVDAVTIVTKDAEANALNGEPLDVGPAQTTLRWLAAGKNGAETGREAAAAK